MARILLRAVLVGIACLNFAAATHAGDAVLKKELIELNLLTGNDAMRGALKGLIDDHAHAKLMLKYALPAAKKKEMSYNAAIVLGLTAAELKDMKTAEIYMRVCMDHAVKVQSFEKLKQSYGLLIELYFDMKQYADCSRVCKELLELNTDDGKDRQVIGTMTDKDGRADFREPQEGFDTAQRLRPFVREIYIKSLAKQQKYDKALELVDGMLKKNNDWIDAHLKGWVLHEANRLDAAAKVYEDVIRQVAKDARLEPEEKDAFAIQFRYEVSNIYIELKKIDRATAHLQFLVKLRPDDPTFQNDLGFVWADNDMNLKEAEAMIRRAIELDRDQRKKRKDFDPKTDQDNGAYLDSLGWVLFKQKKNEEAKEWLVKALEDKRAQHIEIFDHLGDVLLVLGERDAAIRAFENGLKSATENRRDLERKVAVEKKLEKLKDSK
jgi:pentatricopeptide repeat protein